MDVTRTVCYQGSIEDLRVLLKIFNDEGVHAKVSPPDPQEQERRQQVLREQERRQQERRELRERHQQEELRELQEGHQQELRELQEGHQQELRELQERHQLEQAVLELGRALHITGEVVSDLNQVAINLVSTGAAAAIAMAVKKFLKRTPHAKVEVEGEPPTLEDNCPPSPQPHPG